MPPAANRFPVALLVVLAGGLLILAGCLLLAAGLVGFLLPPVGQPQPPGPVAGRTEPEDRPRPTGEGGQPQAAGGNPNVRFGLPSMPDAQRRTPLLERPQYVLRYNGQTLTPDWVCWRLRADDIGQTPRGVFEPDPHLPAGFPRVTSHDYDGVGFDRGVRRASRSGIPGTTGKNLKERSWADQPT